MSVKSELQTAIDEIKAQGVKNIPIENLEAWLADRSDDDLPVDLQTRELVHQSNLAQHRSDVDWRLEEFRSVLGISEFVIRWLIIVSGSACVALLALIGNIWSNPGSQEYICTLLSSLKWFGGSTLMALISAGLFYLAQTCYSECKTKKAGNILRVITIIAVVLAVLGMAAGSICLSVNLERKLNARAENPKVASLETLLLHQSDTAARFAAAIAQQGAVLSG